MQYLRKLKHTWTLIWFQNKSTTPLEIIRIGIGSLLFISYALYSPTDLQTLYGDQGYISKAAISTNINDPLIFSALFHTTEYWQLLSLYIVFLASCLLFAIGWRTSWVKWLVFFGHLSFTHRNPIAIYGVDNIIASMMFIMCLAPVGLNLSMDRIRKIRTIKQHNLNAESPPANSRWGFACTRLIQLQMATLYFYAGISKLEGTTWWSGEALWIAINNQHTAFLSPWIFAHNFWLVNILTYTTIALELAYPFLIWGHKTRPTLLWLALLLHLGIALFMGLHYFAAAMIVGHLAFLRRRWLAHWALAWKKRIGKLEIIYDGNCQFCIRSMAWLLAFDGFKQISIRNYRTNPSPLVSSNEVDKALYTVTESRQAHPGFEAYRYVVARVPGMWWLIPFFYIPVLSRKFGTFTYNWIAGHRHVISNCAVDTQPTNQNI